MIADGFTAQAEYVSASSGVIAQSTDDTREPRQQAGSARRMPLHRAWRQKGLRCLTVELREREIDALVDKKLLPCGSRGDNAAIRKALYAYLDGTLRR